MTYKCPTPIAILMAVYNGEKYMQVQIDSIIEQTNHDWTLYIRDDASTDSTSKIIDDYCSRYNNIITIGDELGNLGFNGNFSKLLEVVEANYYMFCDADDYWMPEKVQVSYGFLQEKERYYLDLPILAHCDVFNADSELNIDDIRLKEGNRFNPEWISDFKHIPTHIAGGATSIFNKSGRIHFFESHLLSLNYDGWLSLQISRYGKIFYIPQRLLIYRRHQSSATINSISHQKFNYILKKLTSPVKTLRYHWNFATEMQALGYGGKFKYFYYRLVVFLKLKWGRLTIRK